MAEMIIHKSEKKRGYTRMSNYHLNDKSLSFTAKGLLSYILSVRHEGWDFSAAGLSAMATDGVCAVRAALKELERAGYLKREKQGRKNGKYGSAVWHFYEEPLSEDTAESEIKPQTVTPCTVSPHTGFPHTVAPCTVKPTQSITNKSNTKKSITKQSITNQSRDDDLTETNETLSEGEELIKAALSDKEGVCEFTDSEIQRVYSAVSLVPRSMMRDYGLGEDINRYHYASEQYEAMKTADEKNRGTGKGGIRDKCAYLLKMLKNSISESGRACTGFGRKAKASSCTSSFNVDELEGFTIFNDPRISWDEMGVCAAV